MTASAAGAGRSLGGSIEASASGSALAASVALRAIDEAAVDAALAVLRRGFPDKPPEFWRTGFERHRAIGRGEPPCHGYLMHDGERDVGVILTFNSEREEADGRRRKVVNLSSWYIDEPWRRFAPTMLKAVLSDDALYTDLTPTAGVVRLNALLGFKRRTEGLAAVLLPWARLVGRRTGRIVPFERIPGDALAPGQHRLLADHARMGCIVAALADGETWRPLIFVRGRRHGVPLARLIYADSRELVRNNLRTIAGFLLRRGRVFLMIDGAPGDVYPGRLLFRERTTQYKGDMHGDGIDNAYSELVFLDLHLFV